MEAVGPQRDPRNLSASASLDLGPQVNESEHCFRLRVVRAWPWGVVEFVNALLGSAQRDL
jgi:hypothetical protein